MVERYLKTNVCPLPWTHLENDVNGGASPCCLYKGNVPNVKVYETGLKEIQKHQYMEDLRTQFKNDADFIRKSRSLLAAEIEKTNSPESAISILKLSALGVPVVVKDMTDAEAWLGSSMVSALNEIVADTL